MIALPIPLIVSLITLYLLLQALVRQSGSVRYWGLLLMCGVQGGLISLVHHYGVQELWRLLPITATTIPPLAWVAFRHAMVASGQWQKELWHALAPLFTCFCVVFAPVTLDVVVGAVFVGYGAAMLVALMRGQDGVPLARLESGGLPVYIWRALAVALIASAISDVLIVMAMAFDLAHLRPIIVSTFSSASLLAIAALGLSGNEMARSEPATKPDVVETTTDEQDSALMQRLDGLMQQERLFLDAELTLARLARRLHVPIKQLSATINRQTGENVSRYVNAQRIRLACDLLSEGRPVTETIYASGFNTKSNFNREFRRVTGKAPRDWLEQQTAGGEATE